MASSTVDEFVSTQSVKSTMTISKAVEVFKNKHSSDMVDRHIRAVNRIAAVNKKGFQLRDLQGLYELLSIMVIKLKSQPVYQQPLLALLRLCGKPFLKQKSSDENNYATSVLQLYSLIGHIAISTNDLIRLAIAQEMASLYSAKHSTATLEDGTQFTKPSYCTTLLNRSSVAELLVGALNNSGDIQTKTEILHTIKLLSTAPTNCNHMMRAGLCKYLCDIIAVFHSRPDSRLIFIGMEILWNLLENGSELLVAKELSTVECIRTLQYLFHDLIAMSNSGMKIKQLRNDVLMICLKIAQLCPDAPFIETGFFSDICTYTTYSEEPGSRSHLRSLSDIMYSFKLTKDHVDFELKKSLICILSSLGTDAAAAKIMASKKVMRALLSYVIQNDKANADWNSAQFEELQLLTLSCLCTIAPLLTVDYMTCQGNTRLLLLVEWAVKNDSTFAGHGNSFHGEGSRGSKVAQLRYCLRLLLSICNCADDAILQDMHEQGAIPMLINILKNFRKIPESDSDDPVLLEMQSDILLILSCICEVDMHKKELFGGYDGVRVLVSYLKSDATKFESGLGHGRLLLAATDCVWCSVVGNPIVEDLFLENEGAFILLDLLKDCPVNMKNLVLGVLVDICENHKAVHHVASWKTIDGCTTWSLLASLWRAEESDMEVPREYLNTLAGTSLPLVGKEQNDCGMPPIATHCPSAAITDVTENMRAKIYTLCCKMGFQFMDIELSMEDRITMCIIENYLDFKTGEVWYEVAGELAQEGLRPVTPDQECLMEILQAHETKAENTLRQQHDIMDQQKRTDEDKESEHYDKIKEYHRANERAKKEFKDFVERTSNYEALKRAKAKLSASLDSSRRSCVAIGDRFHDLEHSRLNTTTMCGRHITISTTPRKLLVAPVVPLNPSPLNSASVDQEALET